MAQYGSGARHRRRHREATRDLTDDDVQGSIGSIHVQRDIAGETRKLVSQWQEKQRDLEHSYENDFADLGARPLHSRLRRVPADATIRPSRMRPKHDIVGSQETMHWSDFDDANSSVRNAAPDHWSQTSSISHSRTQSTVTDEDVYGPREGLSVDDDYLGLRARLTSVQQRRAADGTIKLLSGKSRLLEDFSGGLAVGRGRLKLRDNFRNVHAATQRAQPNHEEGQYEHLDRLDLDGQAHLRIEDIRRDWRVVSSPSRAARNESSDALRSAVHRFKGAVKHTRAKTFDDGLDTDQVREVLATGLPTGRPTAFKRHAQDLQVFLQRFEESNPSPSTRRGGVIDPACRKEEPGPDMSTVKQTSSRQRKRGVPGLIANINGTQLPKTVNDMRYDPVQHVWVGNASALDSFQEIEPVHHRPLLIRGQKTGMPPSKKTESNMVFDNVQMRWQRQGDAEEEDPFGNLSSDDDAKANSRDQSLLIGKPQSNSSPATARTSSRGAQSVLSRSTMEEFPVGEEFDVGPSFVRRQREADMRWRASIIGWQRTREAAQRRDDLWELFRLLHD